MKNQFNNKIRQMYSAKRFLPACLFILFVIICYNCIACAEIDISNCTEEELISLRKQIDEKLAIMHSSKYDFDGAIQGTLIYNENDCILSIASIDQNGCKILIENHSDKDYEFSVNSLAINGIMTKCDYSLGGVKIPAKKKGYMEFKFSDREINYLPQKPYNNISLNIYAYLDYIMDFQTGSMNIVINPTVHENVLQMGANIYKSNGFSISDTKYDDNSITIAVVNHNTQALWIKAINASVNGWAIDLGKTTQAIAILPNCQAFFDISFNKVKKEGNFTTVTDLDFSLEIYGSNYTTRKTEVFTFNK